MNIQTTKYQAAIILFSIGYWLFSASLAQAAAGVPKILNHQGRLFDSSGNLLGGSGTDFCFKFSLYNDAAVGAPDNKLWPTSAPSTMTISVKNGVFNAGIGDTAAGGDLLDFNFQDNDTIFLNVEVASKVGATCAPGDGAEVFENLSPRQRIVSSGYAINASTVLGTGQSAMGTTTPISSTILTIQATSTTATPLTIRGTSGQLADLWQIQNSNGSKLLFIDSTGSLFASSTFQISGTSRFYSDLQVDGSLILGDSAVADTITLNSRFASSLNPTTNNSFDLGFFGLAWRDMYSSGTARLGILNVDNLATLKSGFISSASSTVSGALQVAGALNASSSIFIRDSLSINQTAGAFNSGRFFIDALGNVSASGTLFVKSTTATSTFSTGGLTIGANQLVVEQTSGNVGISTTSLSHKFTVDGRINLDSTIFTIAGAAGSAIISSTGNVGQYTSLHALDANTLFVSYYDVTNADLKFATSTNGGSAWTVSTVDSAGDVGQFSSVQAVDANIIFVSYFDATGNKLKFAKSTNGGSSWTTSVVDASSAQVGSHGDLYAVDANTIFISYLDKTNQKVKFAKSTNGGSSWTTSVVDVSDGFTSLRATDANTIFISYYDGGNVNDLKFAKSTNGGSSWTLSTVDSAGNVGQYTSLHAADANTLFISYYDVTGGDLKFAKSTNGGSSWTLSTVDSAGNLGQYTSLHAADANTLFISYYDVTGGDLKFAKSVNGGSSWALSTADASGDVGQYTSIQAIGASAPLITYYSVTAGDLKFSKFDPSILNVGIGTRDTAGAKLKIDGAVRASGGFITGDELSIGNLDATTDFIQATAHLDLIGTAGHNLNIRNWDTLTLRGGSLLQDKPTNPKVIGGQNLILPGGGLQLNYVSGRYIYMIFNNSAGTDILRIIDVTNPTNPAIVGGSSLSLPGSPRAIYVAGRYGYMAFRNTTSTDVFRIVDISNPANPSVVGGSALSLPANGQHLFVSGRYAYMTFDNGAGTNTFRVIDVANPAKPVVIGGGNVSLPASPRQIYLSGRYAYVVFYNTVNTDAFRIIDVSDPANPSVVGGSSLALGFSTWSIAVSGRYAYTGHDNASSTDNFHVVDISNPANPAVVGGVSLTVPGFAKSLSVNGRYAYVAFDTDASNNQLRIIDVADPTNPAVVGGSGLALPSFPKSIVVNGRYAYLVFFQGAGTDTFRVVDISGLEAVSALLHSLEAGSLQVTTNAQIQNQLAVGGGLNIDGGGLFVSGGVGIGGDVLLASSINSLNALKIQNPAGSQANFALFEDSLGIDQFRVTASGTVLANGFIAKQMQFSEEFVRVLANIVADTAGGGTTGMGDTFAWGAGELGTCTWSTVADALNGLQRQATGATGSGCLTYLSAAAGNRHDILKAINNPMLVFKLRPSVVGANNWVLAGMMDYTDGSVGLPADGVYFSSEGGSEWVGVARVGNIQTRVSCPGQTVLTNQDAYLRLAVASSSVEFFVDNNVSDGIAPISCGTTSTTTPSINLTAEIMNQARSGGTAAMNLDVDYVRIVQDDPLTAVEDTPSPAASVTSRADVAEEIPAVDADNLEAGDLVVLVRGRKTTVAKSSVPYEPTLYGVVSTDPGLILGQGFADSVRVALVGRAPVKINLENGPIEVGDWLTSSGEPGVAMKSIRPGLVIGRAMESYDGSTPENKILVAIESQDWRGPAPEPEPVPYRREASGAGARYGAGSESAPTAAAITENNTDNLLTQILEKLTAAAVQVKKLVSEAIETISLKTRYVEIGSVEEPTGLTLYDTATKEPRCLTVENGEIKNTNGYCQKNKEE